MAEFSFNIEENIGTLSTRGGWALELNRVSWNKRPATYDIRKWSDTYEKMGKGVSMNEDELRELYSILQRYFDED